MGGPQPDSNPNAPTIACEDTPKLLPAPPMFLAGLSRRTALLDLGLTLLVGEVAVRVLSFTLLRHGELDRWLPAPFSPRTLYECLLAATLLGLLAFLRWHHGLTANSFGIRRDSIESQCLWGAGLAAANAVLMVGLIVLLALIFYYWSPQSFHWLRGSGTNRNVLPAEPADRLVLCIGSSIWQEIEYRALLIPYLRRLTGRWWLAVLISSLLFGWAHVGNDAGAAYLISVTLFGVIYGVVFVRSRSLLAVVLAHFALNFFIAGNVGQITRWLFG